MRVREAGDSAVVADLEPIIDPAVNARAIGIAAAVRARRIGGVRDVVPTYQAVAVHFDPLATEVEAVRAALVSAAGHAPPPPTGRRIEVPVAYGGDNGPDLDAVASFARCSPAEVVERHASRTYRVYMLGFLPGYPYMAAVEDTIAAPRRATPRLRVPAGSVAIAGRQTGIYPCDSPGGWQIIGRTPLALFDPEATPPALMAPGDEVQFVPVTAAAGFSRPGVRLQADATYDGPARFITVLRPGLFTTIQDEGRWGYQHLGVPVAGPMDPVSHRLANAVLGNPRGAAVLEATLAGPELRFEHDAWIALAGADLQATVDGREARMGEPVKCRAGSVLRFGTRRAGARAYVAFDGGIEAPIVLGSRATHVLSGLGGIDGRPLRAGDRLSMGAGVKAGSFTDGRIARYQAGELGSDAGADLQVGARPLRVRILPGPQADHFDPSALDALQRGRFTVSPQSDRMGYRLSGARLVSPAGEMISGAVVVGGLQVPPSGDPILLMADRQTTGGYPVLAVVITADLRLAAQLVPGDSVAFRACSRSEAIAALREQEGRADAIG